MNVPPIPPTKDLANPAQIPHKKPRGWTDTSGALKPATSAPPSRCARAWLSCGWISVRAMASITGATARLSSSCWAAIRIFALGDSPARFAEMVVCKIEEDSPILSGHRMFARTNVIPECAVEEFARLGYLLGTQAVGAEQAINRIGRAQHLELPRRIRPGVLRRVGQQDRPRRTQRNEAVLVEWQSLRLLVEFLELGIEPVRETVVDLFDGFADFAATRRGSAAARLKRNHERNPLVKRTRHQCCLAVARVA